MPALEDLDRRRKCEAATDSVAKPVRNLFELTGLADLLELRPVNLIPLVICFVCLQFGCAGKRPPHAHTPLLTSAPTSGARADAVNTQPSLAQVASWYRNHGAQYSGNMKERTPISNNTLSNSAIAELLAIEAETAKMPLQKALRRTSRKAFLWPEEAALLVRERRSLTELPGVGPYLSKVIRSWIEDPPPVPKSPAIRHAFVTVPEAQAALAKKPLWCARLKGDLQMHTRWSDGSGSVEEMARAASDRGYEYIAITDHSKGLKIAGGINERQLEEQGDEISVSP
jgi:hypothetical protein